MFGIERMSGMGWEADVDLVVGIHHSFTLDQPPCDMESKPDKHHKAVCAAKHNSGDHHNG